MTPRCGFVAIIGAPNAGKSTLVNALVGQKIAIVSAKAQTTRTRTLGVYVSGDAQVVLVDTPGIFAPKRRLDRAMVSAAWEGADSADLIVMVVDASAKTEGRVDALLERLKGRPEPIMLVLNKVDRMVKEKLLLIASTLNQRHDFQDIFFVSAENGDGIEKLSAHFASKMPEAPWHYPADHLTDISERLLAAELTREQIYRQLHEELPYAAAVVTEKFDDRKDGSVEIRQVILVERPNQRAIMLGKNGSRIKEIGSAARTEISATLDRPVHLFLHVKASPNWGNSREVYEEIGLDWSS
jgi:GTPase